MGMVCYLRPASARELDSVRDDSDAAAEFLFFYDDEECDSHPDLTDLDKTWHAIHYLLTGKSSEASWPAGFLLEGGHEIKGTDTGYGPMRVLSVDETRQVFQVLSANPSVNFRERFVPQAMNRAHVYPPVGERDGEDGWEYITGYYETLRGAFAAAVSSGKGMVLCVA